MLLVGSRAVQCALSEQARPASPWDVWFTADAFDQWLRSVPASMRAEQPLRGGRVMHVVDVGGEQVNAWVAPPGGSEQAFIEAVPEARRCGVGPCPDARVAPVQALALIKRSHLYDPGHWHKHVEDYHLLRSRCDPAASDPAVRAAGDLRLREWVEQHPEDRGSGPMKIPNEVFFARSRMARIRAYRHDGLHRATCYGDQPLYERLKDDRNLAFVAKRHFDDLTHVDRVRLVREEAYAIALERVVVPSFETGSACDDRRAFLYALRRICTDMCGGWFRDFAIEHYPEIIRYDVDYVGRFRDAVAQGRLPRLPGLPEPDEWRRRLAGHLAEIAERNAQAMLG